MKLYHRVRLFTLAGDSRVSVTVAEIKNNQVYWVRDDIKQGAGQSIGVRGTRIERVTYRKLNITKFVCGLSVPTD